MEKIISDWSTTVRIDAEEAKTICKLTQGEDTCAFLVVDADGFACERMNGSISLIILDRLKEGTMNAKGRGGWKGCAWEGEI